MLFKKKQQRKVYFFNKDMPCHCPTINRLKVTVISFLSLLFLFLLQMHIFKREEKSDGLVTSSSGLFLTSTAGISNAFFSFSQVSLLLKTF